MSRCRRASKIAARLAMLGLPLGESIRWRLLLGIAVSAPSRSKPIVALTSSRRAARAASGLPVEEERGRLVEQRLGKARVALGASGDRFAKFAGERHRLPLLVAAGAGGRFRSAAGRLGGAVFLMEPLRVGDVALLALPTDSARTTSRWTCCPAPAGKWRSRPCRRRPRRGRRTIGGMGWTRRAGGIPGPESRLGYGNVDVTMCQWPTPGVRWARARGVRARPGPYESMTLTWSRPAAILKPRLHPRLNPAPACRLRPANGRPTW